MESRFAISYIQFIETSRTDPWMISMERLIDTVVGFCEGRDFPRYQTECRFDSIATHISAACILRATIGAEHANKSH
ncbi:hypothetical protein [Pseudomonas grimontii]|uniref:hypothetical protein n=1 Tax=Pseudomonas grimontii TaxID=129847 RepID=UPI00387AC4F1